MIYLTISETYCIFFIYYLRNTKQIGERQVVTLGGNDEILLLSILTLKDNAYGATIMKHLTEVTGKEWSIGAIYDPLYRMEKNGYVKSELTEPTNERGGRSKRIYKVTKFGGLKETLVGGEGLVTRITGPGDVFIQTKNLREFVEWLWTLIEPRVRARAR